MPFTLSSNSSFSLLCPGVCSKTSAKSTELFFQVFNYDRLKAEVRIQAHSIARKVEQMTRNASALGFCRLLLLARFLTPHS